MKLDPIIGGVSLLTFFVSFFFYARNRKLVLSSGLSMNDFFSGIFFLRKSTLTLILGRISLFIGVTAAHIASYIRTGNGKEYFLPMIVMWLAIIYFWFLGREKKESGEQEMDFFHTLLFSRKVGSKKLTFFLWLLRIFFIFSNVYALIMLNW